MQEFTFHLELYDAWITYLIGGTVKDLKTYLRYKHKGRLPAMYSWDTRFHFGKDGGTTNGYALHVNAPLGDGEMFYVWIAEATPYLLFHETFHLVGDILFTRGMEYSYGSEEGFAYLGGWIFDRISGLIAQNSTLPINQGQDMVKKIIEP